MTEIRYNGKSYTHGANKAEDITYNNTNVKNELDRINSNIEEQNKKITINNYPYSYPILTSGSPTTKHVVFQTVFMEFDITTNDSADGISQLAFSFDKNGMNIQNYLGGVACPQIPYSAVSGQEASWNCDMQCYVHKDLDGVYVRLRHGKTHNMRVSVFVILQFDIPY